MVREALDRDVPPVDADDAFDDADVDPLGVEKAALLDVQLEVGGNVAALAADARHAIRIATDEPDPVADGPSAPADEIELPLGEVTAQGPTSDQAALLILEDDDLERVSR